MSSEPSEPSAAQVLSAPSAALVEFCGRLRAAGLDVHTGRVLDIVDALPQIDLANRGDVYHTLRTLLVHRHEDFATFDRAFTAFFNAGEPPLRRGAHDEPRAEAEREGVGAAVVIEDDWTVGAAATTARRQVREVELIAEKDVA